MSPAGDPGATGTAGPVIIRRAGPRPVVCHCSITGASTRRNASIGNGRRDTRSPSSTAREKQITGQLAELVLCGGSTRGELCGLRELVGRGTVGRSRRLALYGRRSARGLRGGGGTFLLAVTQALSLRQNAPVSARDLAGAGGPLRSEVPTAALKRRRAETRPSARRPRTGRTPARNARFMRVDLSGSGSARSGFDPQPRHSPNID